MKFNLNNLFKENWEEKKNYFKYMKFSDINYSFNNSIIEMNRNYTSNIIKAQYPISNNSFFPNCIFLYFYGRCYIGLSDKKFNENKIIGRCRKNSWSISLNDDGEIWEKGSKKFQLKSLKRGDLIIYGIDINNSNLLIIKINFFRIKKKFIKDDIELFNTVNNYLANINDNEFFNLDLIKKEYFIKKIDFKKIEGEIFPSTNLEELGKISLINCNNKIIEKILKYRFVSNLISNNKKIEENTIFENPSNELNNLILNKKDTNPIILKIIENHLKYTGCKNTLFKLEEENKLNLKIKSKKIKKYKENRIEFFRKYLFDKNYSIWLKNYKNKLIKSNMIHYIHLLKFLQLFKSNKYLETISYFKDNLKIDSNKIVNIVFENKNETKIIKKTVEDFSKIICLKKDDNELKIYLKFENNLLFEFIINNLFNIKNSNLINLIKSTKFNEEIIRIRRNGLFDVLNF